MCSLDSMASIVFCLSAQFILLSVSTVLPLIAPSKAFLKQRIVFDPYSAFEFDGFEFLNLDRYQKAVFIVFILLVTLKVRFIWIVFNICILCVVLSL